MKLKSLNMTGFAHYLVPLVVVVGIGAIGAYMLVASHAASTQISCKYNGVKRDGRYPEYNCSFYKTTPVVNTSQRVVGYNHAGTNWVLCQVGGAVFRSGSYYNNWWAYTLSDNGTWGWVNGVYGSGGANTASAPWYSTGGFAGVPQCYQSNVYYTSLHSFSSAAPGTVLPNQYVK